MPLLCRLIIVVTIEEFSLNFPNIYGILGLSQKKELMIMRYTITGRNINVTPGIRRAVEEKIGKLDRYFNPDTEVIVTLSVQKDKQKIEVTIPVKGNIIRAEESSTDMYASIDLVEEVIERQLKKYKNKLIDKKQAAQAFSDFFIQEESDTEEDIRIVKTKRFGIKPMDPEEACVQMELLGHNFYVFLNSETEEVNVVYKRKGHSYGLIEPEF
ncbi:ribosome-associated translation inhibitor RaiA [Clostridiaceae bacterium]|nr:ribosome-associated translation inhibitor RaiA [Clostridiaceae bacterium]RKI10576.1 ribosome-associated translation inhibitor RaiA [bacterium 1XD21-70]